MMRWIAGLAAVLLLPACGEGPGSRNSAEPDPAASPGGPATGQPPTIRIIRPESGASAPEGSTITIEAALGDPNADIARVEFYDDNQLIGSTSSPPYVLSHGPLKSGTHDLCAVAVDRAGVTAASSPVTLFVLKGDGHDHDDVGKDGGPRAHDRNH